MVDPEVQKVGLETIRVVLDRLAREAQELEQPLLAFMIDEARLEAENQLKQLESAPPRAARR